MKSRNENDEISDDEDDEGDDDDDDNNEPLVDENDPDY